MALTLTTLPDEALRARLRRAAVLRMHSADPRARAVAGQACLDVIGELRRRHVPLWHGVDSACECRQLAQKSS